MPSQGYQQRRIQRMWYSFNSADWLRRWWERRNPGKKTLLSAGTSQTWTKQKFINLSLGNWFYNFTWGLSATLHFVIEWQPLLKLATKLEVHITGISKKPSLHALFLSFLLFFPFFFFFLCKEASQMIKRSTGRGLLVLFVLVLYFEKQKWSEIFNFFPLLLKHSESQQFSEPTKKWLIAELKCHKANSVGDKSIPSMHKRAAWR